MTQKETFRQQCIRLNEKMNKKGLSAKDERLAQSAVFPSQLIMRSYYGRKIQYCSECGFHVTTSLTKCPCCGAKFKEKPMEQHNWDAGYQCIMESAEDVQVLRFVLVKRYTQLNKRSAYVIMECMRHFYNEQGDRYIFHRNVQGLSMYYDAWCWGSPIVLKREDKGTGYYNKAMQRQNLTVADYRIKSLIKQWQHKPIEDMQTDGDSYRMRIMATPWGELLHRWGYHEMFEICVDGWRMLSKDEQTAVKIAHRHNYEIKDVRMWLDHIRQVSYLHLDCHNPHYVCPKDLRKEHQVMTERYQRERERRLLEAKARENARKLAKMEKEKAAYVKMWGSMLDLYLSGKNLHVRPLQSVEEFAAEGAAMHHCVFANNYYQRPNSLILSAKDDKGSRLATIEFDTKRMTIAQCRAACNGVPARDAEIRALITSHRADFQRLLKAA